MSRAIWRAAEEMTMSETLLEVKHLKKYFNTKAGLLHAVDDVSFSIAKGETLGLVGESGCGKTTLGRTIIRLYNPTSGEVVFNGKTISGKKDGELQKFLTSNIAMVFQDPIASLKASASRSLSRRSAKPRKNMRSACTR